MAYTRTNLADIEDSAAKHGLGELQEARFARAHIGAEQSGLAHLKVKPNQRQPFAHRHGEAEEIHVILSGSGTVKIDDELVAVAAHDVLRIGPESTRAFEAGPDGLEYLVFSPHHEGDAEMVEDFSWD